MVTNISGIVSGMDTNAIIDGILFIDHISRLKRSMYAKKRKKQLAAEEPEKRGSHSGGAGL